MFSEISFQNSLYTYSHEKVAFGKNCDILQPHKLFKSPNINFLSPRFTWRLPMQDEGTPCMLL